MKRNGGFSLVELMVAMVIGLVIILGAGQLFLNGFQSFRQVEMLGDKQAAITFASDVLVREIRRADPDSFEENRNDNGKIKYSFIVDGEWADYDIREGQDGSLGWELYISDGGGSFQPVVSGLESSDDAFLIEEVEDGLFKITLLLEGEASSVDFYAMNRTAAVSGGGAVDDNDSGGDPMDGVTDNAR